MIHHHLTTDNKMWLLQSILIYKWLKFNEKQTDAGKEPMKWLGKPDDCLIKVVNRGDYDPS